MYKQEVIELMSNYIDNMNKELGLKQGMDESSVDRLIKEHRPELEHMNGLLYDMLYENGVING